MTEKFGSERLYLAVRDILHYLQTSTDNFPTADVYQTPAEILRAKATRMEATDACIQELRTAFKEVPNPYADRK